MFQDTIPIPTVKRKRDIIYLAGEKHTAINLEHVLAIGMDGKRISFEFSDKVHFAEFLDEATALETFKELINMWSGDVLE